MRRIVVANQSKWTDRTVEEVNSEYGVIILSNQRNLGSSVERVNPNLKRTIKAGDRLEFKGETSKVMNLFKKCEVAKTDRDQ